MKPPENQKKTIEQYGEGPAILENALEGLSDSQLDFVPSNGGWTIRQIIHHLVDGDDIWKSCIKMALGNQQAEFNLQWYLAQPQTEWAKKWNYEQRPIDISLTLLRAIRSHVQQLLEYAPDAWTKSVQYRNPNGEIEEVPVGFIIQMQADHIVHHLKRISAIREEISGK